MLNKIIELSLKNQLVVLLLLAVCLAMGVRAMLRTAIDAFPDTIPVQVQINTVAPALNPEEIEKQITLPVELAIAGLPGLTNVRSISKLMKVPLCILEISLKSPLDTKFAEEQ